MAENFKPETLAPNIWPTHFNDFLKLVSFCKCSVYFTCICWNAMAECFHLFIFYFCAI